MPPKRGLGRGLDALLPNNDQETAEVSLAAIEADPEQPRKRFPEQSLMALAFSIKRHGLLQPLVVERQGERYRLIAGERRLRAAKLAGLSTVPVHVRTLAEHTRFELALLENLQREDLSSLDEARAYKRLLSESDQTQEELAKRLGISRAKIAGTLRLLVLPADIAAQLESGQLSTGHAKVLAGLPEEDQRKLAAAITERGLSVRQAERWQPGRRIQATPAPDPAWLRQLEQSLGTKVARRGSDKKGVLSIRYDSTEQLNSLLERLL